MKLQWKTPTKKIYDSSDLKNLHKSIAIHKLQSHLDFICERVQGCKIPNDILNMDIVTRHPRNISYIAPPPLVESFDKESSLELSNNVRGITKIFDSLNKLIDETPPVVGPTRFGNIACRSWHDKIEPQLNTLIKQSLQFPKSLDTDGFLSESTYYLQNAFGSKIRLDYGTGHELSFLAFVGSLLEFKIIVDPKGQEVLIMFAKYYDLVRRLIVEYNLEPAGSHGVWGLDDHFHLIYILGASQFVTDKLAPVVSRALSHQVINSHKMDNLYINAVSFIFKLKKGPFNEHSPIIYDIHNSVLSWVKVRQGLLKMYQVEVLNKFPVVQHFWFGEVLYPWKDAKTNEPLPVFQKEETHTASEIPTKIPSRSTGTAASSRAGIPMTAAPWANQSRGLPPNIPQTGWPSRK
ncbi:RRD1 [[Candida] subhashii]|uniref:Serine/threonine-protein phosphatase 2A activator n=1 Tax=[Candida] subhashii TaxID=561895 RepID=A0A8J5QJI2_9ASCO|nr:RRD1 [[Candida] subhashii]KAG7662040.1 RRD1 [[Candida] subhashii]